ncbi:MAG: TIR domain-containing protein [Phototrophicaceae bacterium]
MMKRTIFVSHKNTSNSNKVAKTIKKRMEEIGINCFSDDENLLGGMNWNDEIMQSLKTCDVVVVILDEETGESDWVQREIDMAKAYRISILPVTMSTFTKIETALKRFNMEERQFMPFDPFEIEASLDAIVERIEPLAVETLNNQRAYFDEWRLRSAESAPKKHAGNNNPNEIVFTHPRTDKIKFHVACGDASQVSEFDVLVNTENNYMQMARFFETSTLSYAIRTNGAHFEDNVVLLEDTVQDELYQSAKIAGGLPVRDARVLVTSAGHSLSKLSKRTDYRYIFHVAAVRVSLKDRKVEPIETIQQFIRNCIEKVEMVDEAQGAIKLSDDMFLIEPDDNYQPIQSILFPAFGAGDGGKPLEVSVGEIVTCFSRQVPRLIEDSKLSINKVGLGIYFEEDLELVKQIFLSHDFKVISG